MEKVQSLRKSTLAIGLVLLSFFIGVGCTTKKVMEDKEARFQDINDEYEKVVKVDSLPAEKTSVLPAKPLVAPTKPPKKTAPVFKEAPAVRSKEAAKSKVGHEPKIEDADGFEGRRPLVDPFAPGEKVVLSVKYFNVEAGVLTMAVDPYKVVNGRKAYHFSMNVKSSRTFSLFYAVDDTAETFVDFQDLIPHTYSIAAKESSRLKEVRTFFDWQNKRATHWEKVVKKDEDEKKKKVVWNVEPYSQNVISAIFYLRNFVLSPAKKLAFYVADEGKNYIFRGEVLRREKLDTDAGELNTVVVKLNFELDGQFKQTGENVLWLTDDNRKFLVRIESKVKIGTLVGKLKSIDRGRLD